MTKEQQPIELTTNQLNPTLNMRGNIMPDGTNGGPEQIPPEKIKPEDTVGHLERIKRDAESVRKADLDRLTNAKGIPHDLKGHVADIIREESEDPLDVEAHMMPGSDGNGDGGDKNPPTSEATPAPKQPEDEEQSADKDPRELDPEVQAEINTVNKLSELSVGELIERSKTSPQERVRAIKAIFQKSERGDLDEEALGNAFLQIHGNEEDEMNRLLAEGSADKKRLNPIDEISNIARSIESANDLDEVKQNYEKLIRFVRVGLKPFKQGDLKPEEEGLSDAFRTLTDELDKFKNGKLEDLDALKESGQTIMGKGEFANIFNRARKLEDDVRQRRASKESEDPYPQSLDHLVTLIMASEGEKWEMGGDNQLKNEKGEIQMHNMLAWIREKIDDVTEFNPDSPINLFGEIYIPTQYRTISIGEIIQQVRYFRKDTDGVLDTDPQYASLKDAMLYEVWFAMKNHSYDTEYRQVMGQEEEAVKTLIKNHYEGVFTKDKTRLYNMITFASTTAENGEEVRRSMNGEKRTGGGVGQAMRKMILSYYHIAEVGISEKDIEADPETGEKINMFEKILEDGDEKGAIKFYRAMLDKIISDKFKNSLNFKDENGTDVNLADFVNKRNAEITRHNIEHPDDPWQRLNVITELLSGRGGLDFNAIIKDQYSQESRKRKRPDGMDEVVSINDLIRKHFDDLQLSRDGSDISLEKKEIKRLTELMLRKTFILKKDDTEGLNALNIYSAFGRKADFGALVKEGLKKVFQERENLSDGDIRYAHNRAFATTYWTGISARNDTGAIGFDGASKMMNDTEYRLRQMGKGASGDEENIFGVKKLMVTMWEGLRVTEDSTGAEKSLLELLQGGRGNKVDTQNLIPEFEFSEGNAERQFAVNHLASALGLYQVLMHEHGFNFTKLFKRNNDNKLVVNEEEVDKFRRGPWKFMRYGFDFGLFHYEARERSWWREDVPILEENGDPKMEIFDDGKGHKTEAPTYKRVLRFGTRQLQDLMFSEDITRMNMYRLEDDRKRRDGEYAFKDSYKEMYDENGDPLVDPNGNSIKALRHMSRNVLAYLAAKDLWKHRNPMSLAEDYNEEDFEAIRNFFANYNMELTENPETGETVGSVPVFNSKDWETIAKVSRTTKGDLRRTRILYNTPEIGGGILIEAGKVFMGSLLKAS